jgi:3'(2'), 5'-bisphosphate nucleotidase
MTSDDHVLARDLAAEAGRRLLALRAQPSPPDDLRKAGDLLSHEFLAAELARQRPDDAVLSEEGRDDPARLSADRVWIVDPLDGTREFGEPGRGDWAVHVALWERAVLTAASAAPTSGATVLTAGAVALPAQDCVLSTAEPPLAPPVNPGRLRIVVSRTRPPAFLQRLSEIIDITLVPLGSAGAKAAAVIRGAADAYAHSGGQYEWDSAAPVAVALAAGLHASRIDGSRLAYNQADPRLPDILICQPTLAGPLLEAIGLARG